VSLALIAVLFLGLLTISYFGYGRWVAKQFDLDDSRPTPAHRFEDGTDFVPTKLFYLFGQHFSAIAAAGPIAGPIAASLVFGWLPALLWIAFGVVFVGAVHDFASLTASVKHGALSMAEILKKQVGPKAGVAMMTFIWIALIYIIVAFSDITAGSFTTRVEELQNVAVDFNPGGAVAAASVLYLMLSLIMGLVQRFVSQNMLVLSLIFVPLAFACAWAGTLCSEFFVADARVWGAIIIAYCAVGSLAPVWLLLQPRGYLGGFILYFALAMGIVGIFFGGYEIQQPAFKGWDVGTATGTLFPFLFVTIACGACSGFHGLVCAGTTSKQIDRESHMHPVGYGAMLAEAFVAFIALAIVMIAVPSSIVGLKPGTIYGNGIGEFLTIIIGKDKLPFAITLGAMAFSTFVFDTLDVSTRLGRYLIQELTGWRGKWGATFGTLATVLLPGAIIWSNTEGSWVKFWTLFGASNQLLAALTLLTITLWLHQARKRIAFTLIPMLFVLSITLTALSKIAYTSYRSANGFDSSLLNAAASLTLIVLAVGINLAALFKVMRKGSSGSASLSFSE
jgi:carbon starvation protein